MLAPNRVAEWSAFFRRNLEAGGMRFSIKLPETFQLADLRRRRQMLL
jgi:hypothetical protein